MNLLIEQLLFFSVLAFIIFLPGYLIFISIFGKSRVFFNLEKISIFFGLGFGFVTFLMLILSRAGINLNRASLLISITFSCLFFYAVFMIRKYLGNFSNINVPHDHSFNKKQSAIIILLLLLTIFIKTTYLEKTIFPTSTDLGHHMYWSKLIAESGMIQPYRESDIIATNGNFTINSPQPIADFIIGEHLIFSAVAILGGFDFISAFPSLVLLLMNVFSVISVFIVSHEFFKNRPNGKNIAIATLFFIGPLFALSSPQAKFVSGGVIGNTMGNFFIPLILYFFIRALREKSSSFMSIALFLSLSLAYTHHLSTFVLIFILAFSFTFIIIQFGKDIFKEAIGWLKIFFSIPSLSVIFFGIFMVFFIYTPTYLNSAAVNTAVGSPTKATRTGLSFSQLASSSGDSRIILGIIGLILLVFLYKSRDYGKSILIAWASSLLIMSLWPSLLFIDIPSNRIANYVAMPLSILSAFTFFFLLEKARFFESGSHHNMKSFLIKPSYLLASVFFFIAYSSANGLFDNSASLSTGQKNEDAVQTFESSKYLSSHVDSRDIVLKDHNYITADSWIKLFFMRDYNFPLSRAYFKRYEDENKPREQCSLLMISLPNSEVAKKCYLGTGTDFLMVNPEQDGMQFKKSRDFWQVYQSSKISIFYKSK